MQLGIVTYNIAKDWDLPTIISKLETLGYAGVELRTTHAHKVEVDLSKAGREEVRKRFEDSPVDLAGMGSAFEYQSTDAATVRKNIEGTKAYVELAHDVGSPGVKVRPNGIPKGADLDVTLHQIAKGLREVGTFAQGFGVEIRVEVHGGTTQDPKNFARLMEYTDHPNVFTCWNSNPGEVVKGSIAGPYKLLGPSIREVHLRDLTDAAYPWSELFASLDAQHYNGFTLAEIPDSKDPDRVLRYFKSLWLAYQPKPK